MVTGSPEANYNNDVNHESQTKPPRKRPLPASPESPVSDLLEVKSLGESVWEQEAPLGQAVSKPQEEPTPNSMSFCCFTSLFASSSLSLVTPWKRIKRRSLLVKADLAKHRKGGYEDMLIADLMPHTRAGLCNSLDHSLLGPCDAAADSPS